MKNMLWAMLPILCVVVGCSESLTTTAPAIEVTPSSTPSPSIVVHQYDTYDMTIAHAPTFEFVYNECASLSVEEIVAEQSYEYVINGSFFHYNTVADEDAAACQQARRTPVHVGHLRFGGITYPSKVMGELDHAQLTHMVQYEPAVPRITFIDKDEFVSLEPADVIEFQTGPLVIQNSEIAQAEIENSVNGLGRYSRSLIATTDQTEIFLITTREPVALDALASFLLTLELFQGKRLDVLNLDGGASTLLYAPKYAQLFQASRGQKLPFFIGVPDSHKD